MKKLFRLCVNYDETTMRVNDVSSPRMSLEDAAVLIRAMRWYYELITEPSEDYKRAKEIADELLRYEQNEGTSAI